MTPTRTLLTRWAIAAAVGIGLGAASIPVTRAVTGGVATYSSDRLDTAAAALATDPVYVAPDGRSMLSEADEAALETQIADLEADVKIVVWRETGEAGYPELNAADLLADRFGGRTVVIVWNGPNEGQVGVPGRYVAPYDIGDDFRGEPAKRLAEMVTAAHETDDWRVRDDYWGGIVGGGLAGLLFAVPIWLVIMLVWGLARRAAGKSFFLPQGPK